MADNGIKVSQIAKDLKITSKDIVERLAEFGITVKTTSVLTEEQLGIVFDIYTCLHDIGDEPIVKPPLELEEEKPVEKPVKEVKEVKEPEKTDGPVIVKKAEPVKKVQNKEPAKKTLKEIEKEPIKTQEKRKIQQKGPAKSRKATETVIEIPNDNEKEYVISGHDAKKV